MTPGRTCGATHEYCCGRKKEKAKKKKKLRKGGKTGKKTQLKNIHMEKTEFIQVQRIINRSTTLSEPNKHTQLTEHRSQPNGQSYEIAQQTTK
jgi:hypothetical protein